MNRGTVVALVTILATIVGSWWALYERPAAAADELVLAGTLEAREVALTSEVEGRIATLTTEDGEAVNAGDVLVRLDDALLRTQIARAEAVLAETRARLADVRTGPRAEALAAAEAALVQAETKAEGARQAWQQAQAIRANPQDLEARIDGARGELERADVAVAQAEAALRKAEVERDRNHTGDDKGKSEQAAHAARAEAAAAAVVEAKAARDGAAQVVQQLLAIRENPVALDTAVHEADSVYGQAQAEVTAAQARADTLAAGATPEEVALAEAAVAQAEAALETLRVQQSKMVLRAPAAGVVRERAVNRAEVVVPGTRLLTIADLDRVDLTVYVPEDRLGLVALGQRLPVHVDAYPDRTFTGEVVFIAPDAEFTPRTVQTQEDRTRTVFAVKVRLENGEHALRSGMSAEVRLPLSGKPVSEIARPARAR